MPDLYEQQKAERLKERVSGNGHGELGTVSMADIQPIRVHWLEGWEGFIPLGMATILAGAGGLGKSTVLFDLAAEQSRLGRRIVIATREDHLAAIVRPRLEAAGAALGLVEAVVTPLTFPDDLERLERLVGASGASILVLDPLVAFLGEEVNTNRDHHIRRILAPLAELAERLEVVILCIVHTNKALSSDPLLRVGMSVGLVNAPRSVLFVAKDPSEPARRVLAVAKSNVAAIGSPRAFQVATAWIDDPAGAGAIETSKIQWLGEMEVDIGALLTEPTSDEVSDAKEAREFLVGLDLEQRARPTKDILDAAKAALGIHEKTLQRARQTLGIPYWRESFQGPYWWGPKPEDLPGQASSEGSEAPPGQVVPILSSGPGSPPRDPPVDKPTYLPNLDNGWVMETGQPGQPGHRGVCPRCAGTAGHTLECPLGSWNQPPIGEPDEEDGWDQTED